MDQRAHPRFDSQFEARLITDEGTSHECQITDFSQEGMRLFWNTSDTLQLNPQDTITLRLKVDNQPVTIVIQCLYQDGNSAGFRMPEMDNSLFSEASGAQSGQQESERHQRR